MDTKILFVAAYFEDDKLSNYTMPFIDRQLESLVKIGYCIEKLSLQTHISKINYIKYLFLMRKIVKNNNINLIHAHYSYSVIPCLFVFKVPVVVSLMGTDVFGEVCVTKFKFLKNLLSKLLLYIVKWKCSVIIVKSEQMRRIISRNNVHVVPNGVDFNIFKPIDVIYSKKILSLDLRFQYILFGGNPKNPIKNFDLAQRVLNIVNKHYKNIKIISLVSVQHSFVPFYINSSICLLLTSITEGSPNIVKESIACNVPIVSVDVGDVRERIEKLDMCYVCDYDELQIANAILDIISLNRRPEIRDFAHDVDIDSIANQVSKIYESNL